MELYIVRHAESVENAGFLKGSDPVLTNLGIRQAECLGNFLKNVNFDKIYTSHLSRTIQTATGVAGYQSGNPQITVIPEFSERGTAIDFEANTEFHKTVYNNIVYTKISIEKDYHGDIERIQTALDKYIFQPAYGNTSVERISGDNVIRYNPEKVLIVAHGGINAIILSCLVGFRFDINMNIVQQNVCINKFELFLYNGVPRIKFIGYNDVSYLPEELKTQHP